jgi:hypothetical protein
MTNNTTYRDKDFGRYPKKRALRIYDKTIIVIHESLVRKLKIDENTWFEQELIENGIILKIKEVDY